MAVFALWAARVFAAFGSASAGVSFGDLRDWRGGLGASGAVGARNRAQRKGTRFCARGARVWSLRRVPPVATRVAADVERAAYASGDSGAAVCTGRDDFVVFGAGCAGSHGQLGKPAVRPAERQRAG